MPQRLKTILSNPHSRLAMISGRTNGAYIDEFAHPKKHANSNPFLCAFLANISPRRVTRVVQQFFFVGVVQFGFVWLGL
jgi:hypothetical protein